MGDDGMRGVDEFINETEFVWHQIQCNLWGYGGDVRMSCLVAESGGGISSHFHLPNLRVDFGHNLAECCRFLIHLVKELDTLNTTISSRITLS